MVRSSPVVTVKVNGSGVRMSETSNQEDIARDTDRCCKLKIAVLLPINIFPNHYLEVEEKLRRLEGDNITCSHQT